MINKMTNHRNIRMTWQNDSCILQHALHPTHWTLGSTKSWLNNTTCRSEMFGTLITLTDHKCETAMHDKARITWQNDGHHQPPPIPHNRQNLWNGSTTANHMPQLMNLGRVLRRPDAAPQLTNLERQETDATTLTLHAEIIQKNSVESNAADPKLTRR